MRAWLETRCCGGEDDFDLVAYLLLNAPVGLERPGKQCPVVGDL